MVPGSEFRVPGPRVRTAGVTYNLNGRITPNNSPNRSVWRSKVGAATSPDKQKDFGAPSASHAARRVASLLSTLPMVFQKVWSRAGGSGIRVIRVIRVIRQFGSPWPRRPTPGSVRQCSASFCVLRVIRGRCTPFLKTPLPFRRVASYRLWREPDSRAIAEEEGVEGAGHGNRAGPIEEMRLRRQLERSRESRL